MVRRVAATLAILLLPAIASAQELTPGAYWPLPHGQNIATFVNSYNWGDVDFEPAVPVTEAHAKINTTAVAYTRTLAIAGRTANVSFQLPIVGGHLEGLLDGTPASGDRFGQGDPRVTVGINVYGAPAMSLKEFADYQLRTIVGVSVTVAPPLGQYDHSTIVNLGTNRWSVKSEVGLARALRSGPWMIELMAGVWVFTDNTDFKIGHIRAQQPIGSVQAHLTYRFSRRMWLAGDANFYRGGRTVVDGTKNLDLQSTSRIGSTFSWGFNPHHSLRASISAGAYSAIGANFTTVAVGYNYSWRRQ
jgi:hypothetical protein